MKRSLDVTTGKAAFLLLLFSFGLVACTMVGKVVPVQNRILFSEKSANAGTYNDGELTLDYSYRLTGRKITLDGQITSAWATDSIEVSLLFFDASGAVLQDTLVYYSGYRENPSSSTDSTFKTMLVVPRGAVGMSFTMTDIAHEARRI